MSDATIIAAIIAGVFLLLNGIVVYVVSNRDRRGQKDELVRDTHVIPLLKSAEDLHNRINGLARGSNFVLPKLNSLQSTLLNDRKSHGSPQGPLDSIYSSGDAQFRLHVLYCFSAMFAHMEAVERELGFIELRSSGPYSQGINRHIKRLSAVWSSRRLPEGFNVGSMTQEGKILEGNQEGIGQATLEIREGGRQPISFLAFCRKFLDDVEYRKILKPLIDVLSDLATTAPSTKSDPNVDFRWTKLMVFSICLLDFVEFADQAGLSTLLPELKGTAMTYLESDPDVQKNLRAFQEAYPAPKDHAMRKAVAVGDA